MIDRLEDVVRKEGHVTGLFLLSLAEAEIYEKRLIPNETEVEKLKEMIARAAHLAAKWDGVRIQAERRLEVIEESEELEGE
jgi:hypothetical protein